MTRAAAYHLSEPLGHEARLGVIVLQVDETLEPEFHRLFSPPCSVIYTSRVPSGAALTAQTIATMKAALPAAAALLPQSTPFDVVAYACTSGTTLIGEATVFASVRQAVPTKHVTTPLTAAFAALSALGGQSVTIVSPYIAEVAGPINAAFESRGFQVAGSLSFGEEVESRVARIAPEATASAARDLAATFRPDVIFLSCTNLRTLDIIDPLEKELGCPVLSSNQVLAWHMARLAGLEDFAGPGRLFDLGLG